MKCCDQQCNQGKTCPVRELQREQDKDSLLTLVQDVTYWLAIGVVSVLTVISTVGFSVYIVNRWL